MDNNNSKWRENRWKATKIMNEFLTLSFVGKKCINKLRHFTKRYIQVLIILKGRTIFQFLSKSVLFSQKYYISTPLSKKNPKNKSKHISKNNISIDQNKQNSSIRTIQHPQFTYKPLILLLHIYKFLWLSILHFSSFQLSHFVAFSHFDFTKFENSTFLRIHISWYWNFHSNVVGFYKNISLLFKKFSREGKYNESQG